MSVFTIAALGMIGIPGIVGFMSKFYLAEAVILAGKPYYVVVILLSSFLNAVYYLPIIISAFIKKDPDREKILEIDDIPRSMYTSMIIIGFCMILFGMFPNLLMNTIINVVPTFIN